MVRFIVSETMLGDKFLIGEAKECCMGNVLLPSVAGCSSFPMLYRLVRREKIETRVLWREHTHRKKLPVCNGVPSYPRLYSEPRAVRVNSLAQCVPLALIHRFLQLLYGKRCTQRFVDFVCFPPQTSIPTRCSTRRVWTGYSVQYRLRVALSRDDVGEGTACEFGAILSGCSCALTNKSTVSSVSCVRSVTPFWGRRAIIGCVYCSSSSCHG